MNVAAMKTLGLFVLLGIVLGDVVASLTAPRALTWYYTPGAGGGQMLCDTAKMSAEIFNNLIKAQLIGAAIGAVGFLVLGILYLRRKSNRPTSTTTAPAQASTHA